MLAELTRKSCRKSLMLSSPRNLKEWAWGSRSFASGQKPIAGEFGAPGQRVARCFISSCLVEQRPIDRSHSPVHDRRSFRQRVPRAEGHPKLLTMTLVDHGEIHQRP